MPSTDWLCLKHRGVLHLRGLNSKVFMQGLITNDMNILSADRVLYALLLSSQGRFQHDFFVIQNTHEDLFLTPEFHRIPDLVQTLSKYKLRSDVKIEDLSSQASLLWQNHQSQNEPGTILENTDKEIIFIDPRCTNMGIYCLKFKKNSLKITPGLYHECRIQLTIPDGSLDMIVDKAIPLENNMDKLNAISWTKGCYMGQELTSRTKYSGQVRKALFTVSIKGPLPSFGSAVYDQDEEVGIFKSSHGSQGLVLLQTTNLDALKSKELKTKDGTVVVINQTS